MNKPVPQRSAARRTKAEPQVVGCRFVLDGREIYLPPTAFTHAGFRAWSNSDEMPEFGRITFFPDEILIDMSQEDIEAHVQVKTEMTYALVALNKKLGLGEVYGDGTQISNVDAEVSNIPDLSFVSWESFESGRVRMVPKKDDARHHVELEGSPDWVCEVVSDSSVRKDKVRLRRAYHLAGIREYWLIDARGDDIAFQILWHAADDYVAAEVRRGGWQESRVFGRLFRLRRERGRLDHWNYTLQVKAIR